MKNLASQFVIAGLTDDKVLEKKSLKVFENFYKTLEGKYFVGINDKNETVRFKIGYISYTGGGKYCINIARTPDLVGGVTIHASKVNWFNNKKTGKCGAWLEGCGAII